MPANSKADAEPTAASRSRIHAATFLLLTCGGAAADLLSKYWVFQWRGNPAPDREWWIIPGFFGIETSLNNGALFGIGQGFQLVFAALSVAAMAGILYWLLFHDGLQDGWLTVALGLVCAGIIGNLYDRLGWGKLPGTPETFQNAVRDWILFRFGQFTWPNFNLADSFLVCGAGLMVVHAWRLESAERRAN